ncbi:MAG: hypothetical protein ACK4QL_11075 [Pseudanabaenaceae cyanobacterium]
MLNRMRYDRHRCFSKILWAVERLQGVVNYSQLEEITDLIMQTMTGPWRFFHTPEHIFEVGGEEDPIEVLAALFHDLVYVQVDMGMNINVCRYLAPYVVDRGGQLWLVEQDREDQLFDLAIAIFGLEKHQPLLIMQGQNEFLSALVCLQTLKNMLCLSHLAQITACIEATIPFRGRSACGDATGYIVEQSVSDLLVMRLISVNIEFALGWNQDQIKQVVKRAVRVANRDIGNFASPSPAHFLDNTWNLLPETNHELLNINTYTVQGYRLSLQKMEGFMNFLTPDLVFRQYADEPPDHLYARYLQATDYNLQVARLYLGAKLVAVAIIEALASQIGKEVPLSTMMGELPDRSDLNVCEPLGLEQFLPQISPRHTFHNRIEKTVYELLAKGRTAESPYDVKHSPVATFLVRYLGFDQVRSLLVTAKRFFKGEITAVEYLQAIDPYVLQAIIAATVALFDARRNALASTLQKL